MGEIQPGLIGEREIVVDESLCTAHLGAEVGLVLATPRLSGLFEHTCTLATESLLAEGYSTVGTEIRIKHMGPTPLGFKLRIRVELLDVDGPRQNWRLEAYDDVEKVAEGFHQRAVVNLSKFKARLLQKQDQVVI